MKIVIHSHRILELTWHWEDGEFFKMVLTLPLPGDVVDCTRRRFQDVRDCTRRRCQDGIDCTWRRCQYIYMLVIVLGEVVKMV